MFTVEFESDAAVITAMCEKDEHEDVQVIIGDDDTVFIRQFQEYKNEFDIIVMNYQQLLDIVASIESKEGMFKVERT